MLLLFPLAHFPLALAPRVTSGIISIFPPNQAYVLQNTIVRIRMLGPNEPVLPRL